MERSPQLRSFGNPLLQKPAFPPEDPVPAQSHRQAGIAPSSVLLKLLCQAQTSPRAPPTPSRHGGHRNPTDTQGLREEVSPPPDPPRTPRSRGAALPVHPPPPKKTPPAGHLPGRGAGDGARGLPPRREMERRGHSPAQWP